MKSLNLFDHVVVIAYFLFMLAIGIYFTRMSKGGRDYFAGGNMLPWWVSGMSLYMANFTVWIFTGGAGFAYSVGWFSMFYFGTGAFAYWAGTAMTAAKWRRSRTITPVEYTYTRFNKLTQQFLGWIIAVNFTLSAGVQLAATCKLLAPILGLNITLVVLVTGVVILIYSFLGGLWGVVMTDTLQGVILLSTVFIVVPASLYLVGGFDALYKALPPISFDHMYNGVRYDLHWLLGSFMIGVLGFASGGAQKFYSVKDEKDARRVGWLAGALSLTGPLIFGIPPLVAKVLWPDLNNVEFFKPYIGKNPQDLVYVAICLTILPNGLIGVFVAAMLSATMSTLSSVYNMVASILSKDVYQGILHPETTDRELLRVGRNFSFLLGVIVIVLAAVFVNSQFGIFNLLVAFFTLFNVPVVVPTACGLVFRRVPKWSGVAAIAWGLVSGVVARYVLGWDIGPQVYLALGLSLGVFASSYWVGNIYKYSKLQVGLISVVLAGALSWLLSETGGAEVQTSMRIAGITVGAAIGLSLFWFARLFASESPEERRLVEEFFKRLDTQIDVAKEVFGQGKKQVSTFPLVGGTTIVMGLLMSLILLTDIPSSGRVTVISITALMIGVGAAMWYFGRKSEIRTAEQYLERVSADQ